MSYTSRGYSISSSLEAAVKLDVGGTVFKTTRSTLTKYDSMFKEMLESGFPVVLDSAGCYFIDRDPTHFRYILNFMRDGKVELPDNFTTVQEIMKEAEFYRLQGLAQFCREKRTFSGNSSMLEELRSIKSELQSIKNCTQDIRQRV